MLKDDYIISQKEVGSCMKEHNRESVAGSIIQATRMVEFEDGLWIWEPPKGSIWPSEGPHYTWSLTRGGSHTRVPLGAD